MREVIIFFKKEIIRQSPASAQAPCKIYCQNIHFSNWDCLLGLEAEQSDACWWRRANLMDASVIWNCQHLSSSALQAYGDDASVDSSQTDGSSQLVAHHSGLPHYSEHPLECMFPPPAWGKTNIRLSQSGAELSRSGSAPAVHSNLAVLLHIMPINVLYLYTGHSSRLEQKHRTGFHSENKVKLNEDHTLEMDAEASQAPKQVEEINNSNDELLSCNSDGVSSLK